MIVEGQELEDRLYYLAMYYAHKGSNALSDDLKKLWELNYLTKDTDKYVFNTLHADAFMIAKTAKGSTKLPIELAERMRQLFPQGKKDGTNYQWRDSKVIIAQRLVAWRKMFCIDATDDEIVAATKKYVDSFNGNYGLMRLLKYFIMKKDSDSYTSELASILENPDTAFDGGNGTGDWTVQLWQ